MLNKQQRIDDWNNNPKLCKFCSKPLSYIKRNYIFCNHRCSASFNNKGTRRRGSAPINCLNCMAKTNNSKYCSRECNSKYEWAKCKIKLLASGIDYSYANNIGKRYLIELHVGKCQICLQSEWQGQSMPLVLDHINGNPYDNNLTNLRVICHNCNAQTSTFTGRNKGNGRIERAKRYKIEKQILDELKNI